MSATDPQNRRRILFVDDEPLILQGLRRSLRNLRHEWDMHFAESGAEALGMMDGLEFDVIVTDMRMPHMSGADLLEDVQRRHPRTIRIILSGQAEQNDLMRCIGCAHRFLPKPCEPSELESLLEQVSAIDGSMFNDRFRAIVARMQRVPTVPSVYLEIVEELRKPEAGLDEVASLIEKDPGTTAGILKIVNSAYFGLHRRVSDPREAVRFLGLDMVRSLVLAVGAFKQFKSVTLEGFSLEQLWQHSMATAAMAREIARAELAPLKLQDECFAAGLLHDIGKLVLLDNLPDEWTSVARAARATGSTWHEAETATLGLTHADIGGGILGLWGLPSTLVDAVSFHHNPSSCAVVGLTPVLTVHCADAIVHQRGTPDPQIASPQLDHRTIELVGLTRRVPVWRTLLTQSK